MPSSTWVHISTVGDLVWKYKPKTVLDIGPGFGRWGFLCRELLDVFCGRLKKSEWQTKIYGIEIHREYLSKHHFHIYDQVHIGCALAFLSEYVGKGAANVFDLIIAGDVLEHFRKEDGKKLIDVMYQSAIKAVIICVPIGTGYPQGEVKGNPHEAHLATWEIAEFEADKRVTRVTVIRERIRAKTLRDSVNGEKINETCGRNWL